MAIYIVYSGVNPRCEQRPVDETENWPEAEATDCARRLQARSAGHLFAGKFPILAATQIAAGAMMGRIS
jgi:hypothetical protein